MNRLKLIISFLDNSGREYTASDIVELYHNSETVVGFISFARRIMSEYRKMGKTSAPEHTSSAVNSFIRFHGEEEMPFYEMGSYKV